MVSSDANRATADALCMECGLCCDGTFFGSVVIGDDERERTSRVGLRIVESDGRLAMPQPCSALDGCLCVVYADRPKACREYECTTRLNVLAGKTSGEHARIDIARMRLLLATIRGAFDLESASIWEAILAMDAPEPTDPMSPAGRKLDAGVAAVTELLDLARSTFEPALGGGR